MHTKFESKKGKDQMKYLRGSDLVIYMIHNDTFIQCVRNFRRGKNMLPLLFMSMG
jgi:hypothetical protein